MIDMELQKQKASESVKDIKYALIAIENELTRDFVSSIYINDKSEIIKRRAEYLMTIF